MRKLPINTCYHNGIIWSYQSFYHKTGFENMKNICYGRRLGRLKNFSLHGLDRNMVLNFGRKRGWGSWNITKHVFHFIWSDFLFVSENNFLLEKSVVQLARTFYQHFVHKGLPITFATVNKCNYIQMGSFILQLWFLTVYLTSYHMSNTLSYFENLAAPKAFMQLKGYCITG